MSTEWLIVGGGIHGVHIAIRLLTHGGVARHNLRIVDPGDNLLDRWRECTAVTGMEYLRSPSVHHLAPDANALRRFARAQRRRDPGLFARPYDRPSLELFNAHSEQLVRTMRLEELRVRDHVEEIRPNADGVALGLASGRELVSARAVLAMGTSEELYFPAWAPRSDDRVHHVFQSNFAGWPSEGREVVGVVGGGISALQTAVRLGAAGHRVLLFSRHELKERQFDADPGWLGPKLMAGLRGTRDLGRRRAMIEEARNRGSCPPDLKRTVERAIRKGSLEWITAEIEGVTKHESGLRLQLRNSTEVEVDRLLLATGFTTARPGGKMIDRLVETARLPCADCGFPIVDSYLRWHPRIFVSGPLAELELGPTSRTIAGARSAGERILKSVRQVSVPAAASSS